MKNYGFQPPEFDPKDLSFGSVQKLGGEPINPSGNWSPWLPELEHQRKNGVDVQGCVSFGTLSALEILHKFLYKSEPNFSDRFTAKASETTASGNTPKKVIASIRHSGTVKEAEWPFSSDLDTWEKYYCKIPKKLIKKGETWLKDFEVGYEWVGNTDLKEALKYSPVGVAVFAWQLNDKGEYSNPNNNPPNHWCVLVGFDLHDRPEIWDSYDEGIKILEKGYKFGFPMRYSLKKKVKEENWWSVMLAELVEWFTFK